MNRLEAAVAQEEALTERFKRQNAQLQNSLAYTSHFGANPVSAQNGEAMPSASPLAASILQLTRDSSPESVQDLKLRINQFSAQVNAAGPSAEGARALL